MTVYCKFYHLQKQLKGYWAERILTEIECAMKVSEAAEGSFEQPIRAAVDLLTERYADNNAISKSDALTAEELLLPVSEAIKQYTMHCVAHAHIDMNWMWGFAETVAVTNDTFRTMLDLMNEYPQFTFSQSQASTYRMVEQYDPELLEEIKARVKEGRWEISASTWVEADKNMPNGESFARHVLYTKRYINKVFGVDPDDLSLDFEPDTFGHNWSIPEIMTKSGVKYYYHHRAYDGHHVYRWQSRNNAEVLVFRDPKGYNAKVNNSHIPFSVQFCNDAGIKDMLFVYGVGDHGGGPTRLDLERLIDMQTWPVAPVIRFSTYGAFYTALEKMRDSLPVVNQELNFVFTGCYTTQSRIKMANRIAEDRLYSAEAISACACVFAGGSDLTESYARAWERTLFNQFHDILTGAGIVDTREHALGEFQKVMATANTNACKAMRQIAARIDTSDIAADPDKMTVAEGGGVGYGISEASRFAFPQTERGRGKTRIIHVFNPTEFDRKEPVDIVIWDWEYDQQRLSVTDSQGNGVSHQIVHHSVTTDCWGGILSDDIDYWGHKKLRLLIDVSIPAFGYNTYVVTEESAASLQKRDYLKGVADYYNDADKVMENDLIKAVFKSGDMRLVSLIDKKTGRDLVSREQPACGFRFINEDTIPGMSAWRVGRYAKITDLNLSGKVIIYEQNSGALRQNIKYKIAFENSSLDVCVSLDQGSDMLKFDITADWHEIGNETFVPQLNFHVPFAFSASQFRYDIPFATVDRQPINDDTPGNSFIMALPDKTGDRPLMLVSDTKYGYRGSDNSISVNLIRSATLPDPYPEDGIHRIRLGVGLVRSLDNKDVFATASAFVMPLPFVSGTAKTGSLPQKARMFELAGDVKCSAVKMAEDGGGMIIRLYDANGEGGNVELSFARAVSEAGLLDLTEMKTLSDVKVAQDKVYFTIRPYEVATLRVFFL